MNTTTLQKHRLVNERGQQKKNGYNAQDEQEMAKSVSIYDFEPLPENDLQYSDDFIRHTAAIVLGFVHEAEHKTVLVGIGEGSEMLAEYLKIYHRLFDSLPVSFISIKNEELQLYMSKKLLRGADYSSFTEDSTQNSVLMRQQYNPISNLLNTILLESIECAAQDIHFEFRENEGLVRIIVANKSRIIRRLNKSLFFPLINQLKILAEMNLLEKRLPQDSSFRYRVGNGFVDVRISTIGTLHGESVSLRILVPLTSSQKLDALGYSDNSIAELRRIIRSEHGLLLFCGPTGSGKSTSMNALLREFDPDSKKIISIEDPIEIQNPEVEQIQVNEARGLGFAEILRRVLRRNPDVILLGEIRDPSTAKLAVSAALSGHLIISTIHCSTAEESYLRLQSLGVEKSMIAAVIRGVVSQRLVDTPNGNLRLEEDLYIPSQKERK